MITQVLVNNLDGRIKNTLNAGDTTIQVIPDSKSGIWPKTMRPDDYFFLTLVDTISREFEVVKVTAIVDTPTFNLISYRIVRNVDFAPFLTKSTWSAGTRVAQLINKEILEQFASKAEFEEFMDYVKSELTRILGIANSALDKANQAIGRAEQAIDIATDALGKANQAINTASDALDKANQAVEKGDMLEQWLKVNMENWLFLYNGLKSDFNELKKDTESKLASIKNTADTAREIAGRAENKADQALSAAGSGSGALTEINNRVTNLELNGVSFNTYKNFASISDIAKHKFATGGLPAGRKINVSLPNGARYKAPYHGWFCYNRNHLASSDYTATVGLINETRGYISGGFALGEAGVTALLPVVKGDTILNGSDALGTVAYSVFIQSPSEEYGASTSATPYFIP